MPVPVFTVGEVLTAANMNAVGLWRVTSCTVSSAGGTPATASNGVITVGTNNTSVTVSNAFSSDYDNYRIMFSGGVASGSIYLNLTLGASTTGYYGGLFGAAYATGTPIGIGINNGAGFLYAGLATATYSTLDCDLYAPNLARHTTISSKWSFNLSGVGYSTFNGEHATATQHTSFTITPTSGNITGGQIRVYGYRK